MLYFWKSARGSLRQVLLYINDTSNLVAVLPNYVVRNVM